MRNCAEKDRVSKSEREIFSKNLRSLLSKNGMKDKDLVDVTGASQTAISDWLNGKKYPRIGMVRLMADYFHVSKSYLIELHSDGTDISPQDERDKALSLAVGDKIRFLRKCMNFTQEEIGNYLGVGKATIQKYESGVIPNIPISKIIGLCTILDTTPNELLGWKSIEDSERYMAITKTEYKDQSVPALSIYKKDEWSKFSKLHSLSTITGYLYVAEIGNMIKIGKTINPYGRIMSLKITFENYGNEKIGLCAISEEHPNYTANEKILHRYFAKERIPKSELFTVDFHKALKEIENGWTGISIS